jgi:hypothetical protein
MKNRKTVLAVILAVLLTIPATAYTAVTSYKKSIEVTYGITVTRNGEPIEWVDSNGNVVQPFIYQDTAYVPLKSLAPEFAASTEYIYESNTVNIVDTARANVFALAYESAVNGWQLPDYMEEFLVLKGIPLAYSTTSNYHAPQQNNNYNYNNYYDFSAPDYVFPLHLYSNDGKVYLGKCTLEKYDDESIWYELEIAGDYSSKYSDTSIWNKYGDYGGTLLSYDESAFNDRATNPPIIVDNNGAFIGYLTTNDRIENGWTIAELRQFVENNE